ncbi:MAG: serine/threonine protein kinase [Acidobacteria bacterium]|nr:serine/threonine protein kinase [Acidobacteriota bacterium]
MDPERWRRLKEIFEEAAEADESGRADFLEKACGEDTDLKNEIAALLKHHKSDGFLENPASRAFPDLLDSVVDGISPGKRLGSYTIIEKIARGGMGIVYLAHDERLDRQVAIKMLPKEFLEDSRQKERIRREARAAARLSHPGIATVYSLEESGDDIYIVSEYVKGRTLREVMGGSRLTLRPLLDIALQTARAVAEAHRHGVFHRDLKPENIMHASGGSIKILDFGLARIEEGERRRNDTRLTGAGMFLGTPAYASPEQLLGTDVDFRTDIFSFGVLLYEMAAGKHPFGEAGYIATIARILEGEAPDLTREDPSIPEELDRIVRRCTRKRPENRYPDMQALLDDLELLGQTCGVESKPSRAADGNKATKGPRLHPLWWWQFHQAAAGFGYYGMVYPQWRVKQWLGGVEGSLLFFPLLAAVMIAANLRLHLWFTSRYYASELARQRRKVSLWIRSADCLFVCMLAISAVRIHTMHAVIATLLMAVAIGSLVAFTLIEPTTARAALKDER